VVDPERPGVDHGRTKGSSAHGGKVTDTGRQRAVASPQPRARRARKQRGTIRADAA